MQEKIEKAKLAEKEAHTELMTAQARKLNAEAAEIEIRNGK